MTAAIIDAAGRFRPDAQDADLSDENRIAVHNGMIALEGTRMSGGYEGYIDMVAEASGVHRDAVRKLVPIIVDHASRRHLLS